MKIAILGFGLEGKSLLKFLKKSPLYKNADISVLDKKLDSPPHQTRICAEDAKKNKSLLWCGGKNYLKNLERFNIIFRSPGVPYNLPEIQKVIKNGVKISSGTQLFFEQLQGLKNVKVIGVTGTKGKGTTSTLLYKILKAAGKLVYLAGNIGKPAIELLRQVPEINSSFIILELSSFQLQNLKYSPDIAVVLDIFPDHMDAHKNFKEYINAKANIAKWQSRKDKIFYFNDNKYTKWISSKSPAKKIPVQYGDIGCPNIERIFGTSDVQKLIKIPGEHNLKNAVMAAMVAKTLGISNKIILKTIKNFRGLKHRLEFVRAINKIKFYNDSASTNPQTAAAAIHAFPEQPKILIAGGKDKNLNYSPLAKTLKNSNTKLVVLFGENKQKIAKAIFGIKNYELRIMETDNLKTATETAYKFAKSLIHNSKSIIHILFSPASASFDMFKDHKERGRKFKEIVLKLK